MLNLPGALVAINSSLAAKKKANGSFPVDNVKEPVSCSCSGLRVLFLGGCKCK